MTPLLPRAPSRAPRRKAASAGADRPPAPASTEGLAGGLDREVHVGAGVAVGHRVDVEGVDLLAGLRQGVDGHVDEAPDDREPRPPPIGCFHGLAVLLGRRGRPDVPPGCRAAVRVGRPVDR